MNSLSETVNHVKTELMPDFDYELYEKRQLEWEEKMRLEAEQEKSAASTETTTQETTTQETTTQDTASSDDDISW